MYTLGQDVIQAFCDSCVLWWDGVFVKQQAQAVLSVYLLVNGTANTSVLHSGFGVLANPCALMTAPAKLLVSHRKA